MADDLFAAAAEDRLAAKAPLAERLRPRSLDHVVGQDHLLGPGQPLRVLIEGDRLSSVILWGPPGTGKTTLARVIAGHTAKAFETLSAVTAGVKDVREVVARAEHRLGERGQGTILLLDEVTSALDAEAEYEVFQRFGELMEGRIAVLISHRFSTVRMADRIALLSAGKILELGSHEELIALDGTYARLFGLQAEGYR